MMARQPCVSPVTGDGFDATSAMVVVGWTAVVCGQIPMGASRVPRLAPDALVGQTELRLSPDRPCIDFIKYVIDFLLIFGYIYCVNEFAKGRP